jgi:anti-sigma-K factor RskA
MTPDLHGRTLDRLELYALGELTGDESQEVEDHLRTCGECAEQFGELQHALVALAGAAAITPREDLKRQVMSSIASATPGRAAVPQRAEASRRRVMLWSLSAAAAAVLLLVAGINWMVARSDHRQMEGELRAASASIAELQSRLGRFADQTDRALAILTAGDMREVALTGSAAAAPRAARAYWSPTRGLLLVADQLPEPPPGRVYQVWVIADSTPVSAGLLGDGPARRGMLIVPPPRDGVTGTVTVAVTDEPPGGLQAPSGAIRLAGSV